MDSKFDADNLTNEIFSILENKFLFGSNDEKKDLKNITHAGKIRILSIDGRGSTDGILAAKSLSHLEACLQQKYNDPDACIADFFDVAAGSGVGAILAALLFTKGKDGRPMFSAKQALNFIIHNRRRLNTSSSPIFGRLFHSLKAAKKIFGRIFGECTLQDTLKPVLIPCYDLSTRAPFVFSRADALESGSYDFMMREVCVATTAALEKPFQMRSVDKRTKIVAVDGGLAMNNPTAAAITHVVNNKHEFPFCKGVEDLLVLSLGNGQLSSGFPNQPLSVSGLVNIAGEGASDMVDQAVSMAFGEFRTTNYVRIQANGLSSRSTDGKKLVGVTQDMLAQKNIESILFQGRKVDVKTNSEKLELFAVELIKENDRRKTSIFPTVLFKQVSPRTSSATVSTISSSY